MEFYESMNTKTNKYKSLMWNNNNILNVVTFYGINAYLEYL